MPSGIYTRTDECKAVLSAARKLFYVNGGHHPRGMLGKSVGEGARLKISKALSGDKHYRWKGGYANKLFHNRLRKARKKGASGSHTLEEWTQLKAQYSHMCLCCKQKEPFVILTEDHVVPVSMGGTNDITNIQPLCQPCNSIKWTKIIDYRQQNA